MKKMYYILIYMSFKDIEICNTCLKSDCNITRKQFINTCLPFIDIKYSNINVLNFNKDNYLY